MLIKRLNKVQFNKIGAIEVPGRVKVLRPNSNLSAQVHCYLYKGIVPIRFRYEKESGLNYVDIYPEGLSVIPQGRTTGIPFPRYLSERLNTNWKNFAQAAMTRNIFKFIGVKDIDLDELKAALETAYTEIYHILKGLRYEVHFC